MLNLRISHKGLILVAVPLFFELIFVAILYKIVLDTNRELAEEGRARAIVSHMQIVSGLCEDAAVELARFQRGFHSRHLESYRSKAEAVQRQFKLLHELLADRPGELATLQELEMTIQRVVNILEDSRRLMELGGGGRIISFRHYAELFRSAREGRLQIEELVKPYRKRESESRQAQARSHRQLEQWLLIGVLLNIAIAIALARFFTGSITRRLAILSENSRRLGRGEPLNPKLPGADEISHLDAVFHEMADALGAANRAKQEFVSMISHDLRSPLTSVQGTLTLLEDGAYGQLTQTGHERVETAGRSLDRLIGLINDLLDLEKMEAGLLTMKPQEVAAEEIVNEAIESLRQLGEENQVTLKGEVEPLKVKVDQKRILQVLINLIANAIKFSPPGTTALTRLSKEKNYARITVSDQGPGIPAEYRQSIFNRFQQITRRESSKQGTGLGLAICKAIVEAHGGTIGVESQPGKGSTFWINLPLYHGSVPGQGSGSPASQI